VLELEELDDSVASTSVSCTFVSVCGLTRNESGKVGEVANVCLQLLGGRVVGIQVAGARSAGGRGVDPGRRAGVVEVKLHCRCEKHRLS
jgi:hypothetical protein